MTNLKNNEGELLTAQDNFLSSKVHRRSFLQYAGVGAAGIALVAAGCKKDKNTGLDSGVDLGSGDIGILNYAYALEQLEAAFYIQVALTPYAGITTLESSYLTDIRDHEVAHREFFKNALAGKAITALEVNFSGIDFSKRDSVLATAKAFEDLGVSAYNGAGTLIKSPNYLLLAGKIVSVEARHAALIRDLISNGTFANNEVIDMNGLDKSRTPIEVLTIASAFIKTKINASNLPTS
ncbi:MAG: Tat (Twin-arginine translocation) pathway signal sequence containing protein [Daejeonella sp.]|nr:Tat (Twin-arginine translocation) pathway signal sequence containing protein [Daejeonella sp.]